MVHRVSSSPPGWDYRVVLDCLTNERLSSYLKVMNHDVQHAFHLYEWNMRAAASILTLTSMAEVVVRSGLDKVLSAWASRQHHGAESFDVGFLDHRGHQDLTRWISPDAGSWVQARNDIADILRRKPTPLL